jgi:hypothetical protein
MKIQKKIKEKENVKCFDMLDQIENIRKENNVNWMDLVRLAFRVAPNEAKCILSKIRKKDKEVNDLCASISDS